MPLGQAIIVEAIAASSNGKHSDNDSEAVTHQFQYRESIASPTLMYIHTNTSSEMAIDTAMPILPGWVRLPRIPAIKAASSTIQIAIGPSSVQKKYIHPSRVDKERTDDSSGMKNGPTKGIQIPAIAIPHETQPNIISCFVLM